MIAARSAARAARIGGLTKRYGENLALDRIDLEVAPGELRGLLGLNGAGKTTLLRALFGLIRPDVGTIELLGQRIEVGRRVPMDGVAGFVEDPAFYSYLTGRANLELLVELDGHATPDIDAVLDRVGLAERAGDRVGGYSTGMRQRLGIAAALVRSPRLLLLDEPTSGLDPPGIRAVSALLRELAAEGVAVIVSSHLIGELETLCDSYTILRAGRVVWEGQAPQSEAQAPGSVHLLVTSDDARALALAGRWDGLDAVPAEAGGLHLTMTSGAIDAYIAAVVSAGVGVRRLELLVSPLESLFFSQTAPGGSGGPEFWMAARDQARAEMLGS